MRWVVETNHKQTCIMKLVLRAPSHHCPCLLSEVSAFLCVPSHFTCISMILCTCSHTLGGFLRVYVCTVHICISIHVKSYSTYRCQRYGGVARKLVFLSRVKRWTCIDLYTEMVWGDDNVPSTLSGRQEKAKARLVFLHYECMVKEEEKQLLANRCADAGLPGPVCELQALVL